MTIPNRNSSDQQWVQFYDELKKVFSKKEAAKYWTLFWFQNAGENSIANTSLLRAEMKERNVEVKAGTIGGQIGDAFGDFGDKMNQMLKIFAGVVIVGGVVAGIMVINNLKSRQ